ncbi:hypothetical protein BKA67DRAFT_586555 [Truncatella angustata]|uniref:EamA domain-containing protein n=1 Tax=Truncatella angustata TaxID=152316 RepID=A0A9P8UAL2_9PEZI|nr:uncharacterized protein BKA67DRAFT_586555 [Truncatella angustata]KAH6644957.1 hypothetical protein BKA67DRAFT_586555 [Truncatella angustata]KAH8204268.1 hypothetical protein TruAng_001554 [Truncatella angustata]
MSYGTGNQSTGSGRGHAYNNPSSVATSNDAVPPGDNTASEHDGISEPQTTWEKARSFYERNIGLFLVFMAQVFGSLMTMTTRLLETGFETKFHALQIIFVRMLATAILGFLYMWIKKVPDMPFGDRKIRGLLVLRGFAGFLGLFCSYYSLSFLNISDSTVISFIVPTLTAFICFVALKEPFTPQEALAGVIAFVGVLFIARPTFIFPAPDDEANAGHLQISAAADAPAGLVPDVPVTPAQRSLAVVIGVVGSLGAATAYSTIRVIGKRAHSLVSVNYFALVATIGSFLIILVHPDLEFKVPQSAAQWGMLTAIGIAGFLLQFLLTEGLQREKAGRATNLIYTQLVFALILEKIVWGTTPAGWSFVGAVLIIGAAIWVSLQKQKKPAVEAKPAVVDEESSLLGNTGDTGSRSA